MLEMKRANLEPEWPIAGDLIKSVEMMNCIIRVVEKSPLYKGKV